MRTDRSFARMLELATKKTPDALSFLIRELQTLKGEVATMERGLQEFPGKIEAARRMMDSIEAVITRHPVKIDTSIVLPVRRRVPGLLPRGKLTQMILRVLRENRDRSLSTFTVSQAVTRHAGLELDRRSFTAFNKALLKQLNDMKKRGFVDREGRAEIGVNEEAFWRLASHDAAV